MRALIVGVNDGCTSILGHVLDQAGVAHSTEHWDSYRGMSRWECVPDEIPQLIFFVGTFDSEIDLELIRTTRGNYEGAIVVVADVPSHSAIIQTIRAGATDFVDMDANLSEEVAAILASLQTKQLEPRAIAQLTTVLPCGDPSDANLVSANLAVSIAQRRGGCTLLDFHLRGGDLCHLLQLVPRHTVLDLLRTREEVDQAMFEQALLTHDSNVRLLAGPELFSDLRDVRPSVGQRLITLARSTSPFVVLNAEDVHHAEQARALASGDHVILTTRLDMVSLRRTQRYLAFLRSNGVPTEHVHIVAMGVGRSAEISPKDVLGALSVGEIHCIPADDVAQIVSVNVGRPMVLEMPDSRASHALVQLCRRITGDEESEPSGAVWRRSLRAATIAAASLLAAR